MTDQPNTYVGVDLAGAQTRCIVAGLEGGQFAYLGCGIMPPLRWTESRHWEPQLTVESVTEAIFEAERGAGRTIVSAVLGLGGPFVRSELVRSTVVLPREQQQVRVEDVSKAVGNCADGLADTESVVLQAVALGFSVRGATALANPVGRRTDRLEAFVRVILTDRAGHDHARAIANEAGISVDETVLGGFAAAYATLEERELMDGVAHLDLGKDSSSLTAYVDGRLRMASGLPVGRDQIVRDVARAFSTDAAAASSLITDFGGVFDGNEECSAYVLAPCASSARRGFSARPWPRKMLDKIIGYRMQECMELVRNELQHEGMTSSALRSIVMTGDLASLPGLRWLAHRVVGLRCRVGVPLKIAGLPRALRTPGWCSAVGLAAYGRRLAYSPGDRGGAAEQGLEERSKEMTT